MPPMWIVLALLPILGGAERFNCKGRILGAYYADFKSGCKAFHVCVRVAGGGIRDFRFFCPPGTLFHQEAQTCTDWGDDDPLACPAEIYDGQFDLYKIGSGFDTKKLSSSSSGNRDEEAEFGLQRAETGDRRLSPSQNNPSSGASDLRAAHSSDFFSGQRERGRDDSAPTPAQTPSAQTRPSFRRTTTPRPFSYSATHPTTQNTTPAPSPPPSSPAEYDVPKRKLVRKRPIYVSTPAPPSTFAQNTQPAQTFSEQPQQQQQYQQQRPQPQQQFQRQQQQKQYQQKQYNQEPPQQQYDQKLQQQSQQQQIQQQPQQLQQPQQPQYQPQPKLQQPAKPIQQPKQQQYYQKQQQQQQLQQHEQQSNHQKQPQLHEQQPKQQHQLQQLQYQQPKQDQQHQQKLPQHQQTLPQQQLQRNNNFDNFNRRPIAQTSQTTPPPSIPAQYNEFKDEYVEVNRVTPKQNRYYPSTASQSTFSQTTLAPFTKKGGLVELYNYDSQSTPGLNVQNDYKVRNSFSVSDIPKDSDFVRTKSNSNTFKANTGRTNPTTLDFNTAATRTTSTLPVRNYNSVTYESDKNNFVPFSKQNYLNSPSTTPSTTTSYTTARSDTPLKINAVAYNTNLGFNVQNNFGHDEDDGQYRLPHGEDDGLYKPEIYDRELLSGAHSLNIAASGNRLPEDQKSRGKTQPPIKSSSQTAAPRPFKPAPTPTSPSTQTTQTSESTYSTTSRPQTTNTQRAFDFYQTYTTTSRPTESPAPVHVSLNFAPASNAPSRPTTTSGHRSHEPRPPPPPTVAPPKPASPTSRPPHFANPSSNKEDTSYDYAYYDSDPGFAEYDHIEEFGRTNRKA